MLTKEVNIEQESKKSFKLEVDINGKRVNNTLIFSLIALAVLVHIPGFRGSSTDADVVQRLESMEGQIKELKDVILALKSGESCKDSIDFEKDESYILDDLLAPSEEKVINNRSIVVIQIEGGDNTLIPIEEPEFPMSVETEEGQEPVEDDSEVDLFTEDEDEVEIPDTIQPETSEPQVESGTDGGDNNGGVVPTNPTIPPESTIVPSDSILPDVKDPDDVNTDPGAAQVVITFKI